MKLTTEAERQQTISYIKARLANLSERKVSLLDHCRNKNSQKLAQVKVLDSKIDCLLDNLIKLKKGAGPFSRNTDIEG